MTTETVLPFDRDAVAALSRENNEPEWLSALRLDALQSAGKLDLPKLEKTPVRRWKLDAYGSYRKQAKLQSLSQLPQPIRELLQADSDTDLIVQRNAGVVYEHLSDKLAEQGVIFTDLQTAVREHEQIVRNYLFRAVDKEEHKLAALHAAHWSGGLFLYVPRNVHVEVPLQGLFVADESGASCSPHLLIVAEDNSSVTYVDSTVSLSGATDDLVHSRTVEVFVKPGAKVRFASVHQLDGNVTDVSYRRAVVENDGAIEWILGEMNEGNGVSDTTSVLKGNGSTSDTRAVCIGMGNQQLNLTTRAIHFGKKSDSDMVTRAVMRDNAEAILNGITKIEHGATDANGEQTEKVLMISPTARGDANPLLLIDEDQVTAGHAASVGQIDPNQIYYLMSRGITRQQAERLIIYGFLAPVVSSIPVKEIAEHLQKLVERKLAR